MATAALLEHAKRLHRLLGADSILQYVCREARGLTGAANVVGSCIPPRQPWQRGIHLAVGEVCAPASPAAASAAFAVYRRLSARPEPLQLRRSADSEAMFNGLGAGGDEAALLCALPLVNTRQRLSGQVVLVTRSVQEFSPGVMAALLDLMSLAALALENAQRLAFARRDQDRLLFLAEATEEALWDWDLESNAFWWGGGIEDLIKKLGEIIGTTSGWKFERVHPVDAVAVKESLDRALQSSDSTWRMEYRFRRGDGLWAVVEDRAYFLRDVKGKAYRVLGALRDISEEKWIEAQQRFLVDASAALASSLEVERNLQTVARLAAHSVADWCSIVLFASEGDAAPSVAVAHRDANRACGLHAAINGLVRQPKAIGDEAVTTAVMLDISAEQRRAFALRCPALAALVDDVDPRSALHVPFETGGKVLGLISLITSEGSTRPYGAADRAFAEEFARRCSVAVDKARLFEQAQNAIRARDAFMAILGHELRNPLSPITTALHLMKLRDPRGIREQEVIARQVKHLTRLVDDLLDISRVERGKVELARKPVQLAEVVAKAVEIASPLLEQRRHRLDLQVPSTGLPLLADETRLAQVVANLLTNAARYTDEEGHISVSAAREGKDIVLRVRDNGIGMTPELLPRVFDLFVQGPRTADRRQGGLGLGLSLVRSLVALHGGIVEAHSEGAGKGSEFLLRLPALVVELVQSHLVPTPGEERAAANRKRILIVDDNVDAAEMLSELLCARGHEVKVASDGPRALIIAPRFEPDIAILDIGLPGMDGYELARRLIAALTPQPFLVALTGYGQEQDRARARDAGFDEHIIKPVEPERLIHILEGIGPPLHTQQAERR